WYPFKKTEHLLALMLLGLMSNLLSCLQYDVLRAIVVVASVELPAWSVLRGVREGLRNRLKIDVVENTSALGNPCFGLSIQETEFANPKFYPHLQFIPEYKPGTVINRFSQSRKWHEGFSRDLWVQDMFAKCIRFHTVAQNQNKTHQLEEPNFDSEHLEDIDINEFRVEYTNL
ncbi:hypothetical protein DFH28DRAFT_828680, partial [Melampsora americana]